MDLTYIARAAKAQLYLDHPNDKGNIFCLYGVESDRLDLSERSKQNIGFNGFSKEFGDTALLIHNPKKYFSRIEDKLQGLKIEYNFAPVNYFDPNIYKGELSPFYKSNKYKDQNEVRLWIPNNSDNPFQFYIGDITDISVKIPVTDLAKIEVQVQ